MHKALGYRPSPVNRKHNTRDCALRRLKQEAGNGTHNLTHTLPALRYHATTLSLGSLELEALPVDYLG